MFAELIAMKNSILFATIFSLAATQILALNPSKAEDDNFDVPCIPFQETTYKSGRVYTVQESCKFSKEIIAECETLNEDSIYAQCNIFNLKIDSLQTRIDDFNTDYTSVLFKYAERNSCLDGSNDLVFMAKCDTFAAYLQFIRNNQTDECHAFVNSALLGIQPISQSKRNSPNRKISSIQIPGNEGRIIFRPSDGISFKDQANFKFLKTSEPSKRYTRPGQAVSALSVLKLVSPETMTTAANLKPNPAKIRLTRGKGGRGDYLDFSLGRSQEDALNAVLADCA